MKKEKIIRLTIIILFFIILVILHIFGTSYFAPNSIFINSFLVDILLPCYLFLLFTINFYSLPQSYIKYKKQIKFLFAIAVFLIGFFIETLQYFGVPILGSTFDFLDYLMYLLGTLLGVGIDYVIIKLSK
jgi:hypothetical protein